MFCSTYLVVSLLMNIVPMVSTIVQPAGCNMAKKPIVKNLTVSKLHGRWYSRSVTGLFPRYANLTSYVLEIDSAQTDGQTQLKMTTLVSFSNEIVCSEFKWVCNLNGSICTAVGFDHVFQMIAIDYNSVFAVWSESVEDGETYKILTIFTKDPYDQPDITRIQSNLEEFCGSQAADPTSSFYVRKFSYKNSPCLA